MNLIFNQMLIKENTCKVPLEVSLNTHNLHSLMLHEQFIIFQPKQQNFILVVLTFVEQIWEAFFFKYLIEKRCFFT